MKTCRKCDTVKPLNEFWRESRFKDGYRNECKDCSRSANRRYFSVQANKDRANAKNTVRRRLPNYRFNMARKTARYKGKSWTLTFEEYKELIKLGCYYHGGKLNPTGIGLDRLDNSKGYLPDNVVPCCKECNEIKGDSLTADEAIVAISALTQFRKEKSDGLYAYRQPLQG